MSSSKLSPQRGMADPCLVLPRDVLLKSSGLPGSWGGRHMVAEDTCGCREKVSFMGSRESLDLGSETRTLVLKRVARALSSHGFKFSFDQGWPRVSYLIFQGCATTPGLYIAGYWTQGRCMLGEHSTKKTTSPGLHILSTRNVLSIWSICRETFSKKIDLKVFILCLRMLCLHVCK